MTRLLLETQEVDWRSFDMTTGVVATIERLACGFQD